MNESQPSRRDFFSRVGDGLYGAALVSLLETDLFSGKALAATTYDAKPRAPHFQSKAKAVIQLFMHGGPSQVDLFDPKPMLEKYAGQPPGRDIANDILFVGDVGGMMPSPFKFSKNGESAMEIAEIMPHLAKHVDDIALVRSMFSTNFTHGPAVFMMHGGRIFPDRPTLGAWVVYGLGSENQNLPAYVVLDDPKGLPTVGIRNWQSGWLPPLYQGTRLRSEGSPMLNLKPPDEVPKPVLELERSLLGRLAAAHRDARPGQADLEARIASYELAARMQLSATEALDLSQENDATREMYGLNDELTASYGRRCLMARRLVERGVRMVQIYVEGQIWDNHSDLEKNLTYCCGKTDRPVGALLTDLKQRGLYDSTLVVWGGEFGRLPLSQVQPGKQKNAGRDHGPAGFTVWMGGGGVKGGTVYGATDDMGYKAVEGRVSVHDFHATILHLLGLDHTKLVYNHHGLNEKLTGQEPARVVKEILA
jgi:hypothetical protein